MSRCVILSLLSATAACAALLAPIPAAAKVYSGADRDVPLARFQDALGPGIVGVQQEQAEGMIGLIRQNAGELGLTLADPASTGIPRTDRGNFSIYGVVDQMIWQPDPQGPRSLSAFARLMGAPGDRNLIQFSVNAGLNLKAPLPGRDDDTFGIGFGVAKVSNAASKLDQDTNNFSGPYPVRGSETFLEVTYQYQIAPWWQVQPDFQYVFNPGGGIPNPNSPTQKIGDAAIVGVRTVITF